MLYHIFGPVSYTHLDVYKRQGFTRLTFTAFQTESGWDYVTVFDGVGVGLSLIHI